MPAAATSPMSDLCIKVSSSDRTGADLRSGRRESPCNSRIVAAPSSHPWPVWPKSWAEVGCRIAVNACFTSGFGHLDAAADPGPSVPHLLPYASVPVIGARSVAVIAVRIGVGVWHRERAANDRAGREAA